MEKSGLVGTYEAWAFGDLPIIANYFYHEEVKKSAKQKNAHSLSGALK